MVAFSPRQDNIMIDENNKLMRKICLPCINDLSYQTQIYGRKRNMVSKATQIYLAWLNEYIFVIAQVNYSTVNSR